MRWIVTGMNGTVAPRLAAALRARGEKVLAWDRARVPPGDEGPMRAFVDESAAGGICHLAMGAPEWAASMARLCAERGMPYLFTSSVSVFAATQRGPLGVEVVPEASDDYGRYKQECERQVAAAHPEAIIARLGWQIGDAPGSNTMTDYLTRAAADGAGRVEASTRWIPSSCFLDDTAAALVHLLDRGEGGMFQVEGNPDGLSLNEIATRLAGRLEAGWDVIPTDDVVMDNRMLDPRVPVRSPSERLSRLTGS